MTRHFAALIIMCIGLLLLMGCSTSDSPSETTNNLLKYVPPRGSVDANIHIYNVQPLVDDDALLDMLYILSWDSDLLAKYVGISLDESNSLIDVRHIHGGPLMLLTDTLQIDDVAENLEDQGYESDTYRGFPLWTQTDSPEDGNAYALIEEEGIFLASTSLDYTQDLFRDISREERMLDSVSASDSDVKTVLNRLNRAAQSEDGDWFMQSVNHCQDEEEYWSEARCLYYGFVHMQAEDIDTLRTTLVMLFRDEGYAEQRLDIDMDEFIEKSPQFRNYDDYGRAEIDGRFIVATLDVDKDEFYKVSRTLQEVAPITSVFDPTVTPRPLSIPRPPSPPTVRPIAPPARLQTPAPPRIQSTPAPPAISAPSIQKTPQSIPALVPPQPTTTPTPMPTATPTPLPTATPLPTPTFTPSPTPTLVPLKDQYIITDGGIGFSCGLRSDGNVRCWGSLNTYGQKNPPSDERFTSISSGATHACGLREDGSAICWGNNEDSGQSTPPEGEHFIAISSGANHTCGLRGDGITLCWGSDEYGQASPPSGDPLISISSGFFHNCGLRHDGTVLCWGQDWYDQLTPPSDPFANISAGSEHTCGLRKDGTVLCWGRNDKGQSNPPVGDRYVSISSGGLHTCGLQEDGITVCWGSDFSGQTIVPSGQIFVNIGSGVEHTCGLRENGTVLCWGNY